MNRISKAVLTALVFTSFALGGCGGGEKASGEKTVVYATTGYGREMGDAGLNPHENYSGWSTVRYGVGETLFRLSDAMTPEPWLAKHFEYVDDSTVDIELREGVSFSSGRKMNGEAVKECLEALVAKNQRAALCGRLCDGYGDPSAQKCVLLEWQPESGSPDREVCH